MEKENRLERSVNEANLKLNKKINDDNKSSSGGKKEGLIAETNLTLQDAFNGDGNKKDIVPTYVTQETAAIKITGDE